MKTFCKNRWKISAIITDNSGYNFYSNGAKVYYLPYGNVDSWIPKIPANALPWQYPVLRVEVYENGEYYQTTLDGRIIYAGRCLNQTLMDKIIANYLENPNLEGEINQLPTLYRPGLKALLYTKLNKTENKRYMSMLLWLNKCAATVYKRYNSVRLSYPAVWYNQNADWQEIKATGLDAVMKAQAAVKPKFMSIEDYLEQLGVRQLEYLSKSEMEVVTELVCYMIKVNTSIADEQNQIWKNIKKPQELSETAERKAYLEIAQEISCTKTWRNQDLLSLGGLTEQDMEDFLKFYQI